HPASLSLAPSAPPPSPLSLHDALPIYVRDLAVRMHARVRTTRANHLRARPGELFHRVLQRALHARPFGQTLPTLVGAAVILNCQDRKSTRLNSSHVKISYAVFCLKKKK